MCISINSWEILMLLVEGLYLQKCESSFCLSLLLVYPILPSCPQRDGIWEFIIAPLIKAATMLKTILGGGR